LFSLAANPMIFGSTPLGGLSPKEQRFFSVPAHSTESVKGVARAVQRLNERFRFAEALSTRAGYPKWEKTWVVKTQRRSTATAQLRTATQSEAANGEVLYIPFLLDNSLTTNAILAVWLNGTDTSYRMAYAGGYRAFGWDTTNQEAWNARHIFSLFTLMDYQVFGHTQFQIQDNRLVSSEEDLVPRLAKLIVPDGWGVGTNSLVLNPCITYEVCRDPNRGSDIARLAQGREGLECNLITVCPPVSVISGSGLGSGWSGYTPPGPVPTPNPIVGTPPPPPTGGGSTPPPPPPPTPTPGTPPTGGWWWGGWIGFGPGTGLPYYGGGGGIGTGGFWGGGPGNPDPCGPSIAEPTAAGEPVSMPEDCGAGWVPVMPTFDLSISGWENGVPVIDGLTYSQYYNSNHAFWNKLNSFADWADLDQPTTSFTTARLRNLCIMRGWNNNVDAVTFNRKVGKAFEETALHLFGLNSNRQNYYSARRASENAPNPPTHVRPDALDNYMVHWYDQNRNSHMAQLEKIFGVEVKAVAGTLQLSDNNWQILGELDLLRKNFDEQANSVYWKQLYNPPLNINTFTTGPTLFFITTGDTEIGQTIIDKAKELRISIWQAKAIWNPNTNEMSFGKMKFVYDKSNRYNKGDLVPESVFKALVQGTLASTAPVHLLTPVQPNYDLDPEELKQ
jgi:hypothetical protein